MRPLPCDAHGNPAVRTWGLVEYTPIQVMRYDTTTAAASHPASFAAHTPHARTCESPPSPRGAGGTISTPYSRRGACLGSVTSSHAHRCTRRWVQYSTETTAAHCNTSPRPNPSSRFSDTPSLRRLCVTSSLSRCSPMRTNLQAVCASDMHGRLATASTARTA